MTEINHEAAAVAKALAIAVSPVPQAGTHRSESIWAFSTALMRSKTRTNGTRRWTPSRKSGTVSLGSSAACARPRWKDTLPG